MPAVKLDENVPDSVGAILRESGHDVALARDERTVSRTPYVGRDRDHEGRIIDAFATDVPPDAFMVNVLSTSGRCLQGHAEYRPEFSGA